MKRREWLLLFALILIVRLSNVRILWIEEAYPMAAAQQILFGRSPYQDFWFDKPPLSSWLYLLWGAMPGIPLRLAGAAYVFLCAWLASRLSGRYAAWLIAIYLSFGIPSAVMALAPDLLLVAPHLAAVWMAQTGRPLQAGLIAGISLLIHTKGIFILAVALLWSTNWRTLAGFSTVLPLQYLLGPSYWEQVWWWGRLYSANTFVASPAIEFLRRTANWTGFHASAVIAAALAWRSLDWRHWAWLGLSFVSVGFGLRFFPRYYFFLLVPIVVIAAKTIESASRPARIALLVLLSIPIVRFAPRDIQLAFGDERWDDLALFHDSRRIAQHLNSNARPSDTMFTWGYRPDIDSLARLKGGTPFLESQPLNCVFADRHLADSTVMRNQGCEARLRRFQDFEPTWMVDGLGPSNPRLRLESYHPLRGYELVLRTRTAYLYRLSIVQPKVLDARTASH